MAVFSKKHLNNFIAVSFSVIVTSAHAAPSSCVLLPSETVKLAAPVSGVVEHINIKRGDTVTQGQLVLQLNNDVEKATVALAQARLEFTQRRLSRNHNLVTNQLLAAQEIDEIKTENALAKLELEQALAMLNQRKVMSPISGKVISVDSSAGEYVGTLGSEPFARLVKLDPLHVELVYEAQAYGQLSVGQSLTLNIQNITKQVTGTVDVVDPLIDAASGTFGVRLLLSNPGAAIPAGLRCDVVQL